MEVRVRRIAWMGLSAAMAVATPSRAEDAKVACVSASDEGQQLRDHGKLVDARDKFVLCARDVCPSVVQKDCMQWVTEVTNNLPSLVFSARDAGGQDVLEVRVTENGRVLADKLDGSALFVDPGPHVFRFERSGFAPVEQRAIVRVGEKNRVVTVALGGSPAGAPAHAPPPSASVATDEAPSSGSGKKTAALVVGGLGVVALGVGAYFGFSAIGKRSDSDKECPNEICTEKGVSLNDDARRAARIADVAIGVSIVAIGVGAYLFLTSGSTAPAQGASRVASLRLIPEARPGGGGLGLGGSF